jgi:TP901 family phage tail tape measure protein
MASSDVIARTEELIKVLDSLTTTSNITAESVATLENVVTRLSKLSADASIKSIVTLLNQFNAGLVALEGHADKIARVTESFQGLATAVKQQSIPYAASSAYGKAGAATNKTNAAIASGDIYEARKQEQLAVSYKTIASNIRKEVAGTVPILQETFDLASEAQFLQQSIMQRLAPINVPLLPALTPSTITAQELAADAQRKAAFQAQETIRQRMQRLTAPVVETPAQKMQKLTAGVSAVSTPPPQAPGTIVTGVTGPPTPYTSMVQGGVAPAQALQAAQAAATPIAQVVQQSVQQGAQAGLAAGLQASAVAGAQPIQTGVQTAVQAGTQAGVQAGAQQGAPVVQQTVQQATQAGAQAGTAAGTAAGAGQGLTPGSLVPPQPVTPTAIVQAAMQPGANASLNQTLFQSMGLSTQAADNLENKLKSLGLTNGQLTRSTTELSTGIQTLTFSALDPVTQATKTFTAHLGPMGNLLEDTQKRFRGFGSAIMRDVVEVLKWTIAITAIYTPIRKLGELLEEMKKIQLDLVDVQIVLGDSTKQFNTVLQASSDIATATSSTLEGVIEGYALAAAAAASAGDETQRTVATEKLLKDSMVLSKLANIDQKQALDTLVGSLSQLGMGLGQGTALLDSWVAVSKKANVSVKDMATSFTIVGSAAQEAGLNYNELNALIGTLAQSTNLSADELGNAIRGIISAMQTDKAQQAFAEYGIATKSVNRDFRDLMNILKEVKTMSESGFLDEKAMGALMQAGGAGARRGAQLSAIVKNLDKVMTLVIVSENASGDAATAMALEMGTLDAATTRLNNAFTSLAVTLGGEGGVLGFLTLVTNAVTGLVKGVKDLSSVLKGAAPILAAFMVTKGILGTTTGAALGTKGLGAISKYLTPPTFTGVTAAGESMAGMGAISRAPITNAIVKFLQGLGIGATLTGRQIAPAGQAYVPGMAGAMTVGQVPLVGEAGKNIWGKINKPFFPTPSINGQQLAGTGFNKMSFGTLLGPLLIAASNIGQPGGGQRAAVGGVGGLLGALTGSPLWATVGSVIATAFYDKFLTFSDDLATGWVRAIAEAKTAPPPPEEEGPLTRTQALTEQARQSLDIWETLKLNIVQWGMNTWSKLPSGVAQIFGGPKPTGKQVSDEEILLGAALPKSLIGWTLDEDSKKRVNEAFSAVARNLAQSLEEIAPVTDSQQQEIARLAATASTDIMNKAIEDISRGAAGATEDYINAQTLAQKIGSTVTKLMTVQQFLPTPIPIGTEGKTVTPVPEYKPLTTEEATKYVSELDMAQLNLLISSLGGVSDVIRVIKNTNDQIADQYGVATPAQIEDLATYEAMLMQLAPELASIMAATRQGSQFANIEKNLKPILKLPEMSVKQFGQIEDEGRRLWMEYFAMNDVPPDVAKAWIDGATEYIVQLGKNLTPIKTTIPIEWLTTPIEEANLGAGTQIQQMDVTGGQLNQALAQYPAFMKQLQALLAAKGAPAYQENLQDYLIFTQDSAELAHVDMNILNMLMKDLIDVEKEKGLQGMYNLPAGATFYVPVTAYELDQQTRAEGGGGSIDWNSIAELLAAALRSVVPVTKLEEINPFEGQKLNEIPPGEGFKLGDKEYKMFGPPVPTTAETQVWSVGNPLPVMVTNMAGTPQPGTPHDIPWKSQIQPVEGFKEDVTKIQATPVEPPTFGEWFKNWATQDNVSTDISGFIDTIKSFFDTFFAPTNQTNQNQTQLPPVVETPEVKLPQAMMNWFSQQGLSATPLSATNVTQLQTDTRPVSTALSLSVDSRIILTVDGRTLATIIKPYLYEDLLRYGTSAPTSISRSVVA